MTRQPFTSLTKKYKRPEMTRQNYWHKVQETHIHLHAVCISQRATCTFKTYTKHRVQLENCTIESIHVTAVWLAVAVARKCWPGSEACEDCWRRPQRDASAQEVTRRRCWDLAASRWSTFPVGNEKAKQKDITWKVDTVHTLQVVRKRTSLCYQTVPPSFRSIRAAIKNS